MSVLIKGMEMPKCCAECEWHEYYGGDYDWVHACKRTVTMPIENAETERANDCPLIEVPTPHGRLIDADVPLEKVSKMMQEPDYQHEGENWMVGLIMARDAIDEADTIIEAED